MTRTTGRAAALLVSAAVLAVPAAADAKVFTPRSGYLRLELSNSFGLKLVKRGVVPEVTAPAKLDNVTVTFPVKGGRVAPRKSTIRSRGTVTMAAQSAVSLTNMFVNINDGRVSLQALAGLDGRDYDAFEFATGRAKHVVRTGSRLKATDITLHVTEIGSAALNSQFGGSSFATGERIGTLRVSARS